MDTIIVSRHPAAIEFIARHLGGFCTLGDWTVMNPSGSPINAKPETMPALVEVPAPAVQVTAEVRRLAKEAGQRVGAPEIIRVLVSATADDVRGKHIYGNLPLHLAALAGRVTVIEFAGEAPRGQEYSLADMDAAGARLRDYIVLNAAGCNRIEGLGNLLGTSED